MSDASALEALVQHKSFNWTADRQHIKIGPHTFPRKKLTPYKVSGGTEFYPLDALILLLELANKKLTPTQYRTEADEQSIMPVNETQKTALLGYLRSQTTYAPDLDVEGLQRMEAAASGTGGQKKNSADGGGGAARASQHHPAPLAPPHAPPTRTAQAATPTATSADPCQLLNDKGNKAWSEKKLDKAIQYFTEGIKASTTSGRHAAAAAASCSYRPPILAHLYSNRSGVYAEMRQWSAAMKDAKKCVELAPDWHMGYSRQCGVHEGMKEAAPADLKASDVGAAVTASQKAVPSSAPLPRPTKKEKEKWWAATVATSSIQTPALGQSKDPNSVYNNDSTAHATLLQRIRETVCYVPEGKEGRKQYPHAILNCRGRTPRQFPVEAYRHLHTLCISEAGKRVRNDHPEHGWGVPVEYDYFFGKVVSKINNARAQAGRNSGTKQNTNSRSGGSSATKRTRRSLKCDEDEENGGGDDEDDDGSEDEGDDDDSRDESDDPTRASSHGKKRHKTSATSRTNKTPIAVASKSAASARKQSVRPLSSLTGPQTPSSEDDGSTGEASDSQQESDNGSRSWSSKSTKRKAAKADAVGQKGEKLSRSSGGSSRRNGPSVGSARIQGEPIVARRVTPIAKLQAPSTASAAPQRHTKKKAKEKESQARAVERLATEAAAASATKKKRRGHSQDASDEEEQDDDADDDEDDRGSSESEEDGDGESEEQEDEEESEASGDDDEEEEFEDDEAADQDEEEEEEEPVEKQAKRKKSAKKRAREEEEESEEEEGKAQADDGESE